MSRMDEVEQIGINWDRFIERVREDPEFFLELPPEQLKSLVLEHLRPLASFLGAEAVVVECGKWYARIERIELNDFEEPELSEVADRECYISIEDQSGCDVVVLALRVDESGNIEVFARSAGELLDLIMSGKACDNQDVPWDLDESW